MRTFFSFAHLSRKERKEKKSKPGDNLIGASQNQSDNAIDERNNMTSFNHNQILDSEGQLDDYFTADKNPFARMGESGSLDDLGHFLMKKGSRQQTGDAANNFLSNNNRESSSPYGIPANLNR